MPEEYTTFRVVYHINMSGIDRDMPGGLRISPEEVYIIFPTRDLHLPPSSITSQKLMGNQLAFQFELNGRSEFISFSCEDENEALLISKLLPNPTPDQEQRSPSQSFYEKLDPDPRKSPITNIIIALNIMVFLAMVFIEKLNFLQPENIQAYLDWGANHILFTVDEPWRLFTCAFLHFGLLHIACNMYFLHMLGRLVERLYGRLFYILMYIFAAFTGSLASLLWNEDAVTSAGASGAVFGVVGMLCAYLIIRKNEIPRQVFDSLKKNMILVILMNLAFGASVSGIDNAAHIGGLLGGCLAGLILTRSLTPQKRQAQFMPKLAISLCVLPTIILAIWQANIIQTKPILKFQKVQHSIIENEEELLNTNQQALKQFAEGKINQKELSQQSQKTADFYNEISQQAEALVGKLPERSNTYAKNLIKYCQARARLIKLLSSSNNSNQDFSVDIDKLNEQINSALLELNKQNN